MSVLKEFELKNGVLRFILESKGIYDHNILASILSTIDSELIKDFEYIKGDPKNMSLNLLNLIKSSKRAQYIVSYAEAIKNVLEFETDIITMQIIKELYGFEPNAENIIAYMSKLAYEEVPETAKNDLENARFRFAELLAQIIYKELLKSKDRYLKDLKSLSKKETRISKFFNKDTIMNKLFETTAYGYRLPELMQLLETSSPIEEQSSYYTIKLGGPDGLKPEQQILDIAVLHKNSYGIISAYDTPENNNTSRTNRLTLGAYFKNRYGKAGKYVDNNFAILSPVEALIPFIEHNDGNRVLLATNQLRSVVPVTKPEIPIIMTGGETIFSHLSSGLFIKRADKNGKIIKRTNDYILVEYEDKTQEFINTDYSILKTGKGTYIINHKVTEKSEFKKGDILVHSEYFYYSILQTGINVLCAFMHYAGLTYEDGIVVSETFAKKLGITKKVHILTIPIFEGYDIDYIYTKKDNVRQGQILLRLVKTITKTIDMESEIDDITEDETSEFDIDNDEDQILEAETIGIYKNIRAKRGRIREIEVYANTKQIPPILKNLYEEFNQKHIDYIQAYQKIKPLTESKYILPDNNGKYRYKNKLPKFIIRFIIETYSEAKLGDKLCNRHGNKGVIAKILPDELMPKTELGETIHVILDPMGVINRMNIGQVLEASLAYLAKHAYLKYVKDFNTFATTYKKFISILYQNHPEILAKVNTALTTEDLQKLFKIAQQIHSLPIIIGPFNSPFKNKEIDIIHELEKFVGVKVEQKLQLPEYNTQTIDKVQIGYTYMFRLEHVTEEVMHARYIGRKKGLTKQAVKGKKKEGGYRLGEFDTWQLIANDVPNVIKELFYINSESDEFTEYMLKNIIQNGNTDLPKEYKLRSTELIEIIKKVLMVK